MRLLIGLLFSWRKRGIDIASNSKGDERRSGCHTQRSDGRRKHSRTGKLIRAEASGKPIVLDLKNVILAGQDAIEFLARCEAVDVSLVHCAPYIREWITRQKDGT
jgi:hypothetical protein